MTEVALPRDAAELTRFIETHYHARHRERLPELAALAEKVERVHFGDEDLPDGLADLLSRMIGEMEVHMKKEELILFPSIREGGGPGVEASVAAMRAEHNASAGKSLRSARSPASWSCPRTPAGAGQRSTGALGTSSRNSISISGSRTG